MGDWTKPLLFFFTPATKVSLLNEIFPTNALLQSHVKYSCLPLKSSNELVPMGPTWPHSPLKKHLRTHAPMCQKLLMSNDGILWASKKNLFTNRKISALKIFTGSDHLSSETSDRISMRIRARETESWDTSFLKRKLQYFHSLVSTGCGRRRHLVRRFPSQKGASSIFKSLNSPWCAICK